MSRHSAKTVPVQDTDPFVRLGLGTRDLPDIEKLRATIAELSDDEVKDLLRALPDHSAKAAEAKTYGTPPPLVEEARTLLDADLNDRASGIRVAREALSEVFGSRTPAGKIATLSSAVAARTRS